MDEQGAIYRKVAVGRLTRPDELTEVLGVVRPFEWLLLSAIGLLLGSALVWSVAATLPITVAADGIVQPEGGVAEVRAPGPGRVTRVFVAGGELVEAGAPLLELASSVGPGPRSRVVAPFRARVLDVETAPGDRAAAEAPLLTLEAAERPARAVLLAPESMLNQIRPGLPVLLTSKGFQPHEYGALTGTVSRVARAPLSDEAVRWLLGRDELVRSAIAQGRRLRVDVALSAQDNGSGRLPTGLELGGQIVLRRERPIAWVLPWLRSLKLFNAKP